MNAALSSLAQKEEALSEAMGQLDKLQAKVKQLQEMYDAKMKEKEELIKLVSRGTVIIVVLLILLSASEFIISWKNCCNL